MAGISLDSVYLLNDGTVEACGYNVHGGLGDGTDTDRHTPVILPGVAGVIQVTAATEGAGYLLNDGTVKVCGYNTFGQLGDGSTIEHNTPIVVPGVSGVTQVSMGVYHTVFLLADGTVKACGYNGYGELGNGLTATSVPTPIVMPGLTGVKQVAAGPYSTIALLADGTVKACGCNQFGELGDGTTTDQHSPIVVPGLTGVKQVVVGEQYTVFLLADGTVKACGYNIVGQLGDGSTNPSTTPIVVPGLTGVKQIAAGRFSTFYLLNDGTVKACGWNNYGQLGDGSTTDQHSPIVVPGLTGVKQVAAGQYHVFYLLNDGTVKACGRNHFGQLGDGSTTDSATPIVVPGVANVGALPDVFMQLTAATSAPTNLVATAGDAKVDLTWGAVTGATGYNVKRSTTAGGPYTTVASNVSGVSYEDAGLVNGTTYYYVVTALGASGESANSNEASATPQAGGVTPPAGEGKAILVVNMEDGRREYELSQAEVDAFIAWYDAKAGGSGAAYYVFNKSFNLGPFTSRKDYLVFNEIVNFEVMAY